MLYHIRINSCHCECNGVERSNPSPCDCKAQQTMTYRKRITSCRIFRLQSIEVLRTLQEKICQFWTDLLRTI